MVRVASLRNAGSWLPAPAYTFSVGCDAPLDVIPPAGRFVGLGHQSVRSHDSQSSLLCELGQMGGDRMQARHEHRHSKWLEEVRSSKVELQKARKTDKKDRAKAVDLAWKSYCHAVMTAPPFLELLTN